MFGTHDNTAFNLRSMWRSGHGAIRIETDLPPLRSLVGRADANRLVPVFLCLQGMRRKAEAFGRGLLRVLLLRHRQMSADAGRIFGLLLKAFNWCASIPWRVFNDLRSGRIYTARSKTADHGLTRRAFIGNPSSNAGDALPARLVADRVGSRFKQLARLVERSGSIVRR